MSNKADTCPSCGAPIKKDIFGNWTCEYCGSMHFEKLDVIKEADDMFTAETGYMVSRNILQCFKGNEDYLVDEIKSELAHKMADGIVNNYLSFCVDRDFETGGICIRGRIKMKPIDLKSNKCYSKDLKTELLKKI